MQRIFMTLCSLLLAISLAACGANDAQPPVTISSVIPTVPIVQAETQPTPPENVSDAGVQQDYTVSRMQITIGNTSFYAALAKNVAADAFVELLCKAPVVIDMSDYSGFEKVGSLGTNIPTDNSSITTGEGDIVLYNGNQIVVFYGTHSWDYTRLGKIDDLTKWKEALGDGDVTITFSIE